MTNTQRAAYTCSKCNAHGHNARTCTLLVADALDRQAAQERDAQRALEAKRTTAAQIMGML